MILVTGGCGYIGSVLVERLLADGYDVVVVDNLRPGNRDTEQTKTYWFDCGDGWQMDMVFRNHKPDVVMHLAAEANVEASMTDPQLFFKNNVSKTLNLLDIMMQHDCKNMVFASSAAVYKHDGEFLNPYGESKKMIERILYWYGKAYGFNYIALRLFNVAGASEKYGERHDPETHLIPNMINAALGKKKLEVYGNCERDFVDVRDVAHAFSLTQRNSIPNGCFDIGTGKTHFVEDLMEIAESVWQRGIPHIKTSPRAGDPKRLCSCNPLPGWTPHYTIENTLQSAWEFAI